MFPTLVIADLHHRTGTADAILAAERWERAVFLGDYLDCYEDTPHDALQTALWMKERLADVRCTLLFGNHDLPYAWPHNEHLERPGFTEEKAMAAGAVLATEDWAKLRLFAGAGPWLLSHAGFTAGLVPDDVLREEAALEARCAAALVAATGGDLDPLLRAGRGRGGRQPLGGVTWGDFRCFQPTAGIHQLVGHTPDPHRPLRSARAPGSLNFCLDHRNGHTYAVIEETHTTFRRILTASRGAQDLARVEHAGGAAAGMMITLPWYPPGNVATEAFALMP